MSLAKTISLIENYIPQDGFEIEAQKIFLEVLKNAKEKAFFRTSLLYHFSSSAIILSKDLKEILLAHHNIYNSYGWFGGHNDGNFDFLEVVKKEIREETGLETFELYFESIASLEILPVDNHLKRGNPVCSHTHLNVSYLFVADKNQPIRIKPDENSAIGWFKIEELDKIVREKTMLPIYHKIINRINKKI